MVNRLPVPKPKMPHWSAVFLTPPAPSKLVAMARAVVSSYEKADNWGYDPQERIGEEKWERFNRFDEIAGLRRALEAFRDIT